jgi:cobalamin biosynthesis Mg chelatase CobN
MDGAAESSHAAAPSPPEGTGNQTRATGTSGTLVDEAARVAATLNDKLPTLSQETRIHTEQRSAPAEESRAAAQARAENREASDAHGAGQDVLPSPAQEARAASAASTDEPAARTSGVQPDTRGGRMRQRAATVGASVGENLRPRVEKLREASTVVFDEASDDPGLRFVIIAALLFLLFLFILLFSYILG